MRILAIIDSLGDSGRYFLTVFENGVNRGHHFSVVSTISSSMCNELSRLGVDYLNLGHAIKKSRKLSSLEGLLFYPFALTKIMRIIDAKKIDLIHVHSPRIPLLLGCTASRIKKIPLVLTIHGGRPGRFIKLCPICQAHMTTTTSLEAKEGLPRCSNHVVVIPLPIDLVRFSPDSYASTTETGTAPVGVRAKDTHEVLLVSRLDSDKISAIMSVIESAPKISEAIRNTRIIIVGDGSRAHEVKEAVRKTNEDIGRDMLVSTGFVEDVTELMNLADVVIGVGVVVMEAMACGKPVIVAGSLVGPRGGSFGGIVTDKNVDELWRFNFSGRNSTVRTDAANIFTSVTRLLNDEQYRKSLGMFGREFAENEFGPSRIAERMESAYLHARRNVERKGFPSLVIMSWAILGTALFLFAKHVSYSLVNSYMKLLNTLRHQSEVRTELRAHAVSEARNVYSAKRN